jgi:methanogenesis imperfect marker protein 11
LDNPLSKILEKRRLALQVLRELTKEKGQFTVNDLIERMNLPRSTVQDWISRLLVEKSIQVVSEASGRKPAQYSYTRTPLTSPCKKIITTADVRNGLVEIYHKCQSVGAQNYCASEYLKDGLVYESDPTGLFLRQKARIGEKPIDFTKKASVSIGIERIEIIEGKFVLQTIKSKIGGAAIAVTKTLDKARGCLHMEVEENGKYVTGKLRTNLLLHYTVGVDDTDDEQHEAATWEVTMRLMNALSNELKVESIAHKIVRLYPNITHKTGGNSACFIEVGVMPDNVKEFEDFCVGFLQQETDSRETAIAFMEGLVVPEELKLFARKSRNGEVTIDEAKQVAKDLGIELLSVTGEWGMIGALASIGFLYASREELLDVSRELS